MTNPNGHHAIARKVHALMLDAHPQSGDRCLSEALKLASGAVPTQPGEGHRLELILAIEALGQAIEEHTGAANAESMLLKAIAAAQHWVRSSS